LTEYRVTEDRFRPPWKVEEESACFVVRDRDGQALAHVYFENEARRFAGGKLLKRDEARRIASKLAKLPKLLKKRQ
jgi:hypothetical protein